MLHNAMLVPYAGQLRLGVPIGQVHMVFLNISIHLLLSPWLGGVPQIEGSVAIGPQRASDDGHFGHQRGRRAGPRLPPPSLPQSARSPSCPRPLNWCPSTGTLARSLQCARGALLPAASHPSEAPKSLRLSGCTFRRRPSR
jgi:hypothetical protein